MFLKIFALLFLGLINSGTAKELAINHTAFDTILEWKFLEYEYDSRTRKEQIMNNSLYDKTKNLIIDFDIAKDGRTFVVVIKNSKVPATLNTVSDQIGEGGPLLKPYPDWTWHRRNDCIGIQSVYKIQIDECNRLWVLDNGGPSPSSRVCPSQLLMFDLSSNELQLRLTFPKEFWSDREGNGVLGALLVQSEGWWCQNTNVFMNYYLGTGLVVWNGNKLWRLNGPDKNKLKGTYEIDSLRGSSKSLFGFALSPENEKIPQFLALMSTSTKNIFTVKVEDILATSRDFSATQFDSFLDLFNAIKPTSPKLNDDKIVNYTLYEKSVPTNVASITFSPEGILFLGLNEEIAIGCWNENQNLIADNIDIIDKDKEKLQFVASSRVLQTSRTGNNEEELWILTNKYLQYAFKRVDWNQINYRIMKQTTSRILTNSKCMDSKSV